MMRQGGASREKSDGGEGTGKRKEWKKEEKVDGLCKGELERRKAIRR